MEKAVRDALTRQKIASCLTYAAVFLLPWQTRWIFASLTLASGPWEYGKLSLYAVELLVLLAMVVRGKTALTGSARLVITRGAWFLAAVALSILFSVRPVLSFAMAFHVCVAFVFVILLLAPQLSTRKLTDSFLAGLLAPAALGWYQAMTGTSPAFKWLGLAEHLASTPGASVIETASARVLRAYGSFSHPNEFGGFLAVAMLLLLWRLASEPKRARSWDYATVVVFASALVITFSRGAWIALAAAWLMIAVSMLWFRKTLPRQAIPMIVLCLLAVSVTVAEFRQPLFTRFDPTARLEAKSLDERQGEYGWLDDVLRLNPVTGVGVGAYTVALETVSPGGPPYAYQPLHNTILLILAETGVLGLITLVNGIYAIHRSARKAVRIQSRIFSLALGTILIVLASLDHYLWTDWSGLALAAFCFALMIRWSEPKKEG